MRDATGSHILILQLLSTQSLFLACHSSVPCCILCDQSAGISESSVVIPSLKQLRILTIVTTVQHFNRHSAIKLYRHMHPCEGVIIGI